MIRDAEIRRLARRARVEPRIIDLDYVRAGRSGLERIPVRNVVTLHE